MDFKLLFCLVATILVLFVIIFAMLRKYINLKYHNEELEIILRNQKSNNMQYIDQLRESYESQLNTFKQIKEAKSDEEILKIVNDCVISANNSKLSNNKTDTAKGKTKKTRATTSN